MSLQLGARQGWSKSGHPRRHFFRAGHALCNRRWIARGPLEVSDVATPDDCDRCRRIRTGEPLGRGRRAA